jgi:hypothetical protein
MELGYSSTRKEGPMVHWPADTLDRGCSRHVEAEKQLEPRLQLQRRRIAIQHACFLPILTPHIQGKGVAIGNGIGP